MPRSRASKRISTVTDFTIGAAGSNLQLWGVVVGTGLATAVITLRHGSSTGVVIATINAATAANYNFHGIRCPDGVHVAQTVAAADATIVYGG